MTWSNEKKLWEYWWSFEFSGKHMEAQEVVKVMTTGGNGRK
jgi:hypothetical protein